MHPNPPMRQERKMLRTEFFNLHEKAGQMSRFFRFGQFQRGNKRFVSHFY